MGVRDRLIELAVADSDIAAGRCLHSSGRRLGLAATLCLLLVSCASRPRETVWHPSEAGCTQRAVHETLISYEDAPISAASFRIAIDPDTGQGPTLLAVVDSGKEINLGNPDPPPFFLGVVGDSTKSCAVRVTWEECPAARAVYESLKTQSLPLGFEFEESAEILVLHAPTYYLEFSDGQGNHNQWRFYGLRHPLQTTIDQAFEALRPCFAPAERAYLSSP